MCSEHNIKDFKEGAAVAIIMHMCSQLEGDDLQQIKEGLQKNLDSNF